MTGRGFGRCHFGQARPDIATQGEPTQEKGAQPKEQAAEPSGEVGTRAPPYGGGCGGAPRGCGRGFCGGRKPRWWEKPEEKA